MIRKVAVKSMPILGRPFWRHARINGWILSEINESQLVSVLVVGLQAAATRAPVGYSLRKLGHPVQVCSKPEVVICNLQVIEDDRESRVPVHIMIVYVEWAFTILFLCFWICVVPPLWFVGELSFVFGTKRD
jgi:hypothetical protein